MKVKNSLSIIFLFIMIIAQSAVAERIEYDHETGGLLRLLFGSKTHLSVPKDAKGVKLDAGPNSFYLDTTSAAREGNTQKSRETAPPKTNQIEIKNQNQVIGVLSEIYGKGGVFLANRHLFQNHTMDVLEKSFSDALLDIKAYQFLEFQNNGQLLDVLLIVPTNVYSKIKDSLTKGSDIFNRLANIYSDRSATNMIGQSWASWQWGTKNNSAERQLSSGKIQRISDDQYRIYLDGTPTENYTSARSSSSFVWLLKPDDSTWLLAGIVECLSPSHAAARAISIPALWDSNLYEVDVEKISQEPRWTPQLPDDCEPIDGRRAGGG